VKQSLKQIESEIFSIFDHLHQNPEISWKEVQTTKFLKEQLEKLGYRVQTFDDCTGVIGEIGEGDFTVGFRADMDALWQ
jgi:amidohydrolase